MTYRALACFLFLAACGGASTTTGDPGAEAALAKANDTQCRVTFRFLQKDAYANYAGRTTSLWPPHTTTAIDVDCGHGVQTSVRENHGSKPDDLAADGQPFLVETKRVGPVRASVARTRALIDAYTGCECAPETTFLSQDVAKDLNAQQMVEAVAAYIETHMVCDSVDPATLADEIVAGQIEDIAGALATCAWDSGEDWAEGFTTATKTVLGAQFGDYHVCNNDAELESALFDTFAAGEPITACDATSDLCHGPKWFYTP